MRLIEKLNQYRRDLDAKVECEACKHEDIIKGAYDDRNYWDNVLPAHKCKSCGKSSYDLGSDKQHISTKYADYEVV